MSAYKIYLFCIENGETEFVVISDQPEMAVAQEFGGGGMYDEVRSIDGDFSSFPCDRKLFRG